jgi:hypothetical protein
MPSLAPPAFHAVAEAAAAEVDADPNPVLLVGEDVDVVVARADGAELARGLVAQVQVLDDRPRRVVEQVVVYTLRVLAADAEADGANDVVHDPADAGARDVARHVDQDGLVAASDVVADTGRRDGVLVRDHAADGNGVALVVVGHQHSGARCWMVPGTANLVQGSNVHRIAEHGDAIDQIHVSSFLAITRG